MKRKTKILLGVSITLIIAIVCYVIAGVVISNYNVTHPTYSSDVITGINKHINMLNGISDEAENEKSEKEISQKDMVEYFENMKSQGKIKDYFCGNGDVMVEFLDGGKMYVNHYRPGYQSGNSTSNNKSRNEVSQNISSNNNTLSVLTAQPYANDSEMTSDVFDNSATLIENSDLGYQFTDNIDDENVTIDFMKSLSKYKVIIFDGHGVYNPENNSFVGIALGEYKTTENYDKYIDEINNGRLSWTGDGRYVVTPAFFEHYYKDNSFNDTLIYFGCCDVANDDSNLSEILIKKGAEAVLAYKNSVNITYNRSMCETIFNELVKKDGNTNSTKTIAEALETAKKQNGEKDPTNTAWYDFILHPIFQDYVKKADRAELILTENDDNSFRLIDENKKEDIKTSTTENESTIIKETTTKEKITENDLKNELLNYYWENNFGETNIYDFSNDNTVVIYYGDFSSSKSSWSIIMKINYSIKNDELFLDWYNNGKYDVKLDYITKTQNNNLDRNLNFYNALDNDEYFFYDTNHTDGFQNAIYLKKGAKKEDTKTISEFDIYQPILKDYYNNCKKEHSIYDIHSFCKYTLYDIDENGVNELIVQSGTSEGDRTHYVYTCENNQSKLLGKYNAWHLGLYGSNKKIIAVDGMGGNWTIYNIIISNDEVVKKEIKTVESADIPTYSNKLDFYELYDYSIFNN